MSATDKMFPEYRRDSLFVYYYSDSQSEWQDEKSTERSARLWRFHYDEETLNVEEQFMRSDKRYYYGDINPDAALFPVTTEPDNSGKRTLLMPSVVHSHYDGNEAHQWVTNLTLNDDAITDSSVEEKRMPQLTFGKGGLITDVKAGLHAYKDIDYNEFVAVAGLRRDNDGQLGNEESDYTKTYAAGSLKFFVVSDNTFKAVSCDNMPTFQTSGTMPTFRIAAGDFDGDGTKSELAIVTGSREDEFYHLHVYKMTYSEGKLNATSIHTETTPFRRFKRPDKYAALFDEKDYGRFADAAVLTAGDFDGDGYQELAMGYGDFDGERSHPGVVIYKWANGTLQRGEPYSRTGSWVMTFDGDSGSTNIYGSFGMNMGTGRFSGYDRDEIVLQFPYLNVAETSWYGKKYLTCKQDFTFLFLNCDEGSTVPKEFNIIDERYLEVGQAMFGSISDGKYTSGIVSMKGSYLPHLSSLAVGAFYSRRDSDTKRPCDDIAFSINPLHGTALVKIVKIDTHTWRHIHTELVGEGDSFVGLCAGDFYGESFRVGSPLHLMIRNRNNYVALMQVPPFHVDFIPEAWSSGDAHFTPKVTNVSHTADTLVSYLHSTTTKSSESSKFSTKFTEEAGVSVKESAEASTPEIFGCKAYAETTFTASVNAEASQAIDKTDSATKSMNMKFESGTNDVDNMVAYESVFHIWRYPIYKPLFKDYRGAVDDDASMFMTFTVCDDLVERTGSPGDLYFATHEEGNLFSYPTRVGDIPGYDENKNQMTLGTPITKTADGLLSQTLGITEGFTEGGSTTVTGKVTASMAMSEKVGVEAKVAKASVEVNAHASLTAEVANCETFTKSYPECYVIIASEILKRVIITTLFGKGITSYCNKCNNSLSLDMIFEYLKPKSFITLCFYRSLFFACLKNN